MRLVRSGSGILNPSDVSDSSITGAIPTDLRVEIRAASSSGFSHFPVPPDTIRDLILFG
jgi:hypothetical protein